MLYLQNMWIERTIYVTAYKLPGILRWFEVKSVFMVRSICLYWDCIKGWGSHTAREHLYLCMAAFQSCEQAINGAVSGVLRQGDLLAENADDRRRVARVMLFHSCERGSAGWLSPPFRARSDGVLEALLSSICGFQQVSRCGPWRVPKTERWRRGTLLHQIEFCIRGFWYFDCNLFKTYHKRSALYASPSLLYLAVVIKGCFCFFAVVSQNIPLQPHRVTPNYVLLRSAI